MCSDDEHSSLLKSNCQHSANYESLAVKGEFQQNSELSESDGGSPTLPTKLTDQALQWWKGFYAKYHFLFLVAAAISVAYIYPPFAGKYLFPRITADWITVVMIFVLSGLNIKTEELKSSFRRIYFNSFVQGFNFFAISVIIYAISSLLLKMGILPRSLADGMVICSTLPTSVNMVMVLTNSANGDNASAIFHAAFGNLVGVFLSPLLILGYLGVSGDVNLYHVFITLLLRVLLPIFVGQLLHIFVPSAREFAENHSKQFKRTQENCLAFILYTVFCETFQNGTDASMYDIILMICLQIFIQLLMISLAWTLLTILFPGQPRLQAMGVFGCTHKTAAMGVPLIGSIYENNPLAGMYTLPLLAWHISQVFIGTALAPHIAEYVNREEEKVLVELGV